MSDPAWILPGRTEPPEPIGKPVTLTAVTWEGGAPVVGDCLGSVRRRFSYQILEVRPRKAGGYRLRCQRIALGTEPGGCRYFTWTWARRERRSRSLSANDRMGVQA